MHGLIWPILLMALGLILVIAEVFVPSGGMIGLLALGLIVVSIWQAFAISSSTGLAFLLADALLLPMAMMYAVYLWPKMPMANKVFLRPPDPEDVTVTHGGGRLDHLIGQFGRALTPLRPSGLVDFDGRRIDGVSEEGLIDPGSLVTAVRVQSGRLVVRAASVQTLDDLAG